MGNGGQLGADGICDARILLKGRQKALDPVCQGLVVVFPALKEVLKTVNLDQKGLR